MSGMKVYLANGNYLDFPNARTPEVEIAVDWYKTASPGQVITLRAETMIAHIQKAHIVNIEENR